LPTTSVSSRAQVLTPTPGMVVRTLERGCAATSSSTFSATLATSARSDASWAASRGSTTAAALVPVTTTVWAGIAAKISSVSRPRCGVRV